MEVFPSIEDLRTWADRLEEVQDRLAPYFERAEPRQRVMAYLRGLVSITGRKNGWQLAELAGEATPDGMQRLLNTAKWDADQVRDDLQQYILTQLPRFRAKRPLSHFSPRPPRGDWWPAAGESPSTHREPWDVRLASGRVACLCPST